MFLGLNSTQLFLKANFKCLWNHLWKSSNLLNLIQSRLIKTNQSNIEVCKNEMKSCIIHVTFLSYQCTYQQQKFSKISLGSEAVYGFISLVSFNLNIFTTKIKKRFKTTHLDLTFAYRVLSLWFPSILTSRTI